jgi:hypothetical protein
MHQCLVHLHQCVNLAIIRWILTSFHTQHSRVDGECGTRHIVIRTGYPSEVFDSSFSALLLTRLEPLHARSRSVYGFLVRAATIATRS